MDGSSEKFSLHSSQDLSTVFRVIEKKALFFNSRYTWN